MFEFIYGFFNSPFFTSILTGLSTGIGVTTGAWLVTHNIKFFERIWKKLDSGKEKCNI